MLRLPEKEEVIAPWRRDRRHSIVPSDHTNRFRVVEVEDAMVFSGVESVLAPSRSASLLVDRPDSKWQCPVNILGCLVYHGSL